ncbi:MAG: UvrD-helicase domain-containing protein [Schleiferiaceae bacterium]|nr:UvrD-helicase domain-containing protein [Schleiferiaceae bacterium]
MSNLLSQLNDSQRLAVEATEGPVMVIAGAGSGKTRVLTFRIAYLMQKGVDAFNILALTFTNKAAKEMKERIGRFVGYNEAKNLWMGTFHSVFARILRVEGHLLGYPQNFTIYDADDSKRLISGIIKELSLDKDIYKAKQVFGRISALKNNLITPKGYHKYPELLEADSAARMPMFIDIYTQYTERCFRSGAMDFDDLLLKTNELLTKFPEVLAKYQERFKYILVDEYQDTNHSQYLIVKSLASRFENICVVGDDAQSIYAFRGANIRNILNFQSDYPNAQLYKLEQNYRSTNNIVQAANSIIKHNKEQLEKNVWTENPTGEKIKVRKLISDTDEGNFVTQTIFDAHMNEQRPYSDFCILYRTNAQSRPFEDSLRRKNIPYQIYGGLSFYQRKEIKDLLAYVRLAVNPDDEEAFRRVINYPARGIGQTTIEKLTILANQEKRSFWGVCDAIAFLGGSVGLNRATQNKIADWVNKIKSYRALLTSHDAFFVVSHIAKTTGIIAELGADKTPEGVSRYENVQELLNGVQEFVEEQRQIDGGDPSLAAYLTDIALLTATDKKDENIPKVSMMTIHLAKGLEFPYVFIVGLEENLFPSMMAMGSRADLEEERRLFYVALTRAEQVCYLTYTQIRYRWGKIIDGEPSRFIEELDDAYVDFPMPEIAPDTTFLPPANTGGKLAWEPRKPAERKPSFSGSAAGTPLQPPASFKKVGGGGGASGPGLDFEIEVGQRVMHDRFGVGTVAALEGANADVKAIIAFDNAGEKRLLLKYAKLKLV